MTGRALKIQPEALHKRNAERRRWWRRRWSHRPACLNFDSKKMSKQNNNKKQQPQQQNPSSSLHLYSVFVTWKKWTAENVHAVLYNLIKKSSFYLHLCVFCTNYRTKVHLKMVNNCLIWGWWCSGGFFSHLQRFGGKGWWFIPCLHFFSF